MPRLLAVVVLAVVVSPVASAGVNVESPVLHASTSDGFADDCETAPLCVFAIGADGDPGEWSVNVRQSIRYVGVAINGTPVEEATGGLVALPPHSIRFHPRDVTLPNPVVPLVDTALEGLPHTVVQDHYWIDFEDEGFAVRNYAPLILANPTGPWDHHEQYFHWNGSQGLGYWRITPFYNVMNSDFDVDRWGVELFFCDRLLAGSACEVVPVADALDALGAATPNIEYGIRYETTEAATDPSALHGPAGEGPVSGAQVGESEPVGSVAATDARRPLPANTPPMPAAPAAVPASAPAQARVDSFDASSVMLGQSGVAPEARGRGLLSAATASGLLLALALALYQRLTRRDLLEQPTRARILEIVRRDPGVRAMALARALGLDHKAVDYQLYVLERNGLVVTRDDFGQRRVFANGEQPSSDAHAVASLVERHPVSGPLLARLRQAGSAGAARRDLHASLGVARSTLNWHIKRLIDLGFAREGSAGRVVACAPDPAAAPSA